MTDKEKIESAQKHLKKYNLTDVRLLETYDSIEKLVGSLIDQYFKNLSNSQNT